jgi:hypothetical protein
MLLIITLALNVLMAWAIIQIAPRITVWSIAILLLNVIELVVQLQRYR